MSATQPQLGDEASVSLDVLSAEVVEESTPLTDQHEEPATTVMVVFVLAQMLGQMVDSLAEQGDLHFGGACIALVRAVLGDDLSSCFHHASNLEFSGGMVEL
jgi:hypothetical protein